MLALHLLQSALVYINTLLLQDLLSEDKWQKRLTDADRQALSPLFWTRVNPYGWFELDMNSRLDLDLSVPATVPGSPAPQGEQSQLRCEHQGWPEISAGGGHAGCSIRRQRCSDTASHKRSSVRVLREPPK